MIHVFTLHNIVVLVFSLILAFSTLKFDRIRRLKLPWIIMGLIALRLGYMLLRLHMGKPIFDQDIELYYKYGSSILEGKPVNAEYPELALLLFALAALPSRSLMDFRIIYPLVTLPLGCLATYILYRLCLLLGGDEAASTSAMLYGLSPFTAIFWMFKFDEVAVAFALLGLYFMASNRRLLLGLAAALGFLVKWFPALILPAALLYYLKSNRRAVPLIIGVFTATATSIMFLFHKVVEGNWLHAYIFHGSRTINIESLYSLIEHALTGRWMGSSDWTAPVYMTNEVVLAAASAATILWLIYLAFKVNEGNLVYLSSLTIIFGIIFNKVYSTQFITWLLPVLLICFAQLHPEAPIAHGVLTATAVQILNYLRVPILSHTPWWIIPSILFYAINIAFLIAAIRKGFKTEMPPKNLDAPSSYNLNVR